MTAAAKDKEGKPAKFLAELIDRETIDKDTIAAGLKDKSVGIGKYIKEEEELAMIDGLVPANGVRYQETLVLNIEGPKITPALRRPSGAVKPLPEITSAAIVEGLARVWLFPQGDDPNTGGLGIAEGLLGREQSWLIGNGDRFQTGFRPVPHVGSADSSCHSVLSDLRIVPVTVSCRICGVHHVTYVRSAESSCSGHDLRSVLSDAQCHFRTCPQS